MLIINAMGLSCPQPVLLVLQCIREKNPERFRVIVDNEASFENISRAAKNNGYNIDVLHESACTNIELYKS